MRTMMAGWLVLVGCGPKTQSPAAAVEEASMADHPRIGEAWTLQDYQAAYQTVLERAQAGEPVPGLADPVFQQMADLDAVSALLAAVSLADAVALQETVGGIVKVYVGALTKGTAGGAEVGALTAAFLRVLVDSANRLQEELGLTAESLRQEPVRKDGFLRMRYGLRQVVMGVVTMTQDGTGGGLRPTDLVGYLNPVWEEVVAFMLPEEASTLRGTMASDPAWAPLLPALDAGAGTHPLVADLLDDHRAFSQAQDSAVLQATEATNAVLALGGEGDGTRYAFPDQSFSAVFPLKPRATQQTSDAGGGTQVHVRLLTALAPSGASYNATCFVATEADPALDFDAWSTALLEGMGAVAVPVEVPEGTAKQVRVADDESVMLIRLVPLEPLGCMIAAEYLPADDTPENQALAEAFVESLKVGR